MIAFFPGKFQPPHLGHILTIMDLYHEYDKIIIGITEDGPYCISRSEAMEIFRRAFQNLPKVKVVLIPGALIRYQSQENLPCFDVLLSGNQEVINWAQQLGLPCKSIPRAEGIGFSGTFIRAQHNT